MMVSMIISIEKVEENLMFVTICDSNQQLSLIFATNGHSKPDNNKNDTVCK